MLSTSRREGATARAGFRAQGASSSPRVSSRTAPSRLYADAGEAEVGARLITEGTLSTWASMS